MFNKVKRNLLSGIMAAAVVATTVVPAPLTAFADEAKTVKVEFSVRNGEEWILEPTELTVSADLDDKYKDIVKCTDDKDEPTTLDAFIAAQIAVNGTNSPEGLECYSSGWIKKGFGLDDAVGYRLNDVEVMDPFDTLKDNDEIRYFGYNSEVYLDKYIMFDKKEMTVNKGETVDLAATYTGYNWKWEIVTEKAANLDVYLGDTKVGTTDENGMVSFEATESGVVIFRGEIEEQPIVTDYFKLTVMDETVGDDDPEEPVVKKASSIEIEKKTVVYNGKTQRPKISKTGSKKTVEVNVYADEACTTKVTDTKDAGTYYFVATVGEDDNYLGATSEVTKFVIEKASQKITKLSTSKAFSRKSLKKKSLSFKLGAKAKGKLSYKKVSYKKNSKKLSVSKNGVVKVKKGTKKGTYKIKVKVTAAATNNYKGVSVTKVITVKVK